MISDDNFEGIVKNLYNLRGPSHCKFCDFQRFACEIFSFDTNPKIIHIAGTNGKGSVCALLESVYRSAGYKTGLFISPHIIDIRERIKLNGISILSEDFYESYLEIFHKAKKFSINLSFFQYLTLIALFYFKKSKPDVLILECGIGGRLDSTNIINSIASVITSISLDHEDLLGNNLEEIAREKAGIIKKNTSVFVGELPSQAEFQIKRCATDLNCKFYQANKSCTIETSLAGDFQKKNAALALLILQTLSNILPVSDGEISHGFANTFWPARNQKVTLKNGNTVIFDGAHNGEAIFAQRKYVEQNFDKSRDCLIFSSTKIRHYAQCLDVLVPYFSETIITNISDDHKKLDSALFKGFALNHSDICEFLELNHVAEYLSEKTDKKFLITGSLLLIGELAHVLIAANQLDEKCFQQV